jgi:hypothetical protein
MFKVAKTRCNECLFGESKIVDDERRDTILAECEVNEQHFVCHKFSVAQWLGLLTESEANVCCNGFYRAYPDASQLMQIAGRLNLITFVDVPTDDELHR